MLQASLICLVVIGAPPSLANQAESQQTEQAWSADSLADALLESNQLVHADFDTTFEFRILEPRGMEVDGPWDPTKASAHESFRYVVVGKRLCIQRLDLQASNPATAYEQTNIWSDGTWTHHIRDEASVSLYARPVPTDLFGQGLIFNLLEGRFPSYPPLEELVRSSELLRQSCTGGILTYRFAGVKSAKTSIQYEIRAELKPRFKLLSCLIEVFGPGDQAPAIGRQTLTITKWREEGDLCLPDEAAIDGWKAVNPDPKGPSPLLSKALYQRTSFRLLGPNDSTASFFETPMPLGTKVYDARLNLSYNIGDAFLYLDGTLYQLDEPILKPPGDGLSELLRTAHAKANSAPGGHSGERVVWAAANNRVEGASLGSKLMIPLGILFAVGLGAVLAFLRWHRPRTVPK